MSFLFVTNRGNGTVSAIRPDNLFSTLSTMQRGTSALVASPDYSRLFVANSTSSTVSVFSLTNGSLLKQIPVGRYPVSLAVDPNGIACYVLNRESRTVTFIDMITLTASPSEFSIGRNPLSIKTSPSGNAIYISYETEIVVYEPQTFSIVTRYPVGGANFMELTPDGQKLICTNFERSSITMIVSPYSTNSQRTELLIHKGPTGLAITKDGLFAYVCCSTDNTIEVVSISGSTPRAQRFISRINSPSDIAFDSNDIFYYVTSAVDNVVYSLSRSGNRLDTYRNNNPRNPFSFSTPSYIIATPELLNFRQVEQSTVVSISNSVNISAPKPFLIPDTRIDKIIQT
ncbi:YncE family protein [Paenibacillus sp. FSL H3-0286]|uniref:YncE family protein n=1 Tax=Paenibacillus sp. FSL H3-0286 TaxID=2921427 RepID=UPI0032444F5E